MFQTEECVGRCSDDDLFLFSRIYSVLTFLRKVQNGLDCDIKKRIWPNCHSLCRGLKIHFGDLLKVIDGHIVGLKHYQVIESSGGVYTNRKDSIQHSWLVLPDKAIVDPFPAGVYATSPLLFPPFGQYHEIMPANIYIETECALKNTQTDEVWRNAGNIALVFSMDPESDDLVKVEQATLEAIKLVESFN